MRWVVLIVPAYLTALSFGQITPKKTMPAQSHPDTYQRSKECAAQAEKLIAEDNRRAQAQDTYAAWHWENHYSPKYNRCFVSATYITPTKDGGGKTVPLLQTELVDAFERSPIAHTASVGPTDGFCDIDEKSITCAEAARFIAEHMKN